nr:hypothetical protein HI0195 - Haemophilus influenzae (strain Rd KW20) [Haemophilus influenzae]
MCYQYHYWLIVD